MIKFENKYYFIAALSNYNVEIVVQAITNAAAAATIHLASAAVFSSETVDHFMLMGQEQKNELTSLFMKNILTD